MRFQRRAVPAAFAPALGALGVALGMIGGAPHAGAVESVQLTGVPDYEWYFGCFGTASGNLIGYWDRHGYPDFYTGPTNAGLAPLDSFGTRTGIRSMWASQAGFDGRPANRPGHIDDYYVAFESTAADPYLAAHRSEHPADCIGDFIGLSQAKWTDLGGECSGNIDGFSFNYFDHDGRRRDNFSPTASDGSAVPDIQSGLRAWAASRGYAVDTFSQLSDFNPDKPAGRGFTFADLRAEIDAGFPVLLFMQAFGKFSRDLPGHPGQNPEIHGMLAYGYVIDDSGVTYVRYKTSWASGDRQFSAWTADNWTPDQQLYLPLRGVIGFHPRPKLTSIERGDGVVHLRWEGPTGTLHDDVAETDTPTCRYVVERATSLQSTYWEVVSEPTTNRTADVSGCCDGVAFYRVRLLKPGE